MTNKLLLVANWKANDLEATRWLSEFNLHISQADLDKKNLDILIAPPFPQLFILAASANLASQDVSQFDNGPYTGEVTAKMVNDLDVHFTLVGHSERRKYFGETTQTVGQKMEQAINNGLTTILCAQDFSEIPKNLELFPTDEYFVMYEPFTAISTQGSYHPEDPSQVEKTLKEWQEQLPPHVRFLYGGSVNSQNIKNFLPLTEGENPILSGFVVGHASLDPKEFANIIKQCP